MTNQIEYGNKKVYESKKIIKSYVRTESLQKPEQAILDKIKGIVSGKSILDIGVGGGRTIKPLMEISNNYIGIDYSEGMIKECQKKYSEAHLFCQDARDMSIFPNDSFSLVIFSFNGIDYVSHSGRLKILREIHRILKDDGFLIFSSHNRDYYLFNCFKVNSPVLTLKWLLYWAYSTLINVVNHAKHKKYEVINDEYAIINDSAAHYTLMTYYISIEEQIRQLKKIGFKDQVESYDIDGEIVLNDTKSCWIYYLAKK